MRLSRVIITPTFHFPYSGFTILWCNHGTCDVKSNYHWIEWIWHISRHQHFVITYNDSNDLLLKFNNQIIHQSYNVQTGQVDRADMWMNAEGYSEIILLSFPLSSITVNIFPTRDGTTKRRGKFPLKFMPLMVIYVVNINI